MQSVIDNVVKGMNFEFEYLKGSEKRMKNSKSIDGIPCGV